MPIVSLIIHFACSAFLGAKGSDVLAAVEPLDGPYITRLCELVGRLKIWLSVGGFPEIAAVDAGTTI